MSSDWWLNRAGTAAAAATPSGSVPEYGLAMDIGTAPWSDQQQFNAAIEDLVRRRQGVDLARMQATKAEDDRGWFQKAQGAVFGALGEGIGFIAGGPFQDLSHEDSRERAEDLFHAVADNPVGGAIGKGLAVAYDYSTRPFETAFIASSNAYQSGKGWWLDPTSLGQAWREAEDTTPGQALVDWFVTGANPETSDKDLDRIRRTNSLYGLTSFAGDLYFGFKLDPTVIAGKTAGELHRIKAGALPRGQTSAVAAAEARRTVQGRGRYTGANPMGHYGSWRGQRLLNSFAELREAAKVEDFATFSARPMFRRQASNGPQAAYAMQLAAKDDALWDLTQRAVMADPRAWREIRLMREDPLALREFSRTMENGQMVEAPTFIDAVEATKTKMADLQSEIDDLERLVTKREAVDPSSTKNAGYFTYYNKELHATLEKRVADLQQIDDTLRAYDDYGKWLDTWGPVPENQVVGDVEILEVNARQQRNDYLSQRTYQKNLYGPVHHVQRMYRKAWLKEANPFDLHHSDFGAASIRRQFEQFKHLYGYADAEGLNSTLERFTSAVARGEHHKAFEIAREVEEVHHIRAAAQHFNLSEDVIRAFLDEVKLRRNQMVEALLKGDKAVYSTMPGITNDSVQLLRIENGEAIIRITEGTKKAHTMRLPEDSLRSLLASDARIDPTKPFDPTQTPNYYTPMNVQEVKSAIFRDHELFKNLEGDLRNKTRQGIGMTLNGIDWFGTKFNAFWKPLQLFRLAWPQRVLMDEMLRGMAVLGMGPWMKTYSSAFRASSLNAVNPLEHATLFGLGGALAGGALGAPLGPFVMAAGAATGMTLGTKLAPSAFVKRARLKIGPGPLADEITGKSYDIPKHELDLADTPFVPERFAAKPNKRRAEVLGTLTRHMADVRRHNIRVAARYREGVGGTGQIAYDLPINQRLARFMFAPVTRRTSPSNTPMVGVFDTITGKPVRSGYAVPVKARSLRKSPMGKGPGAEVEIDSKALREDVGELTGSGTHGAYQHDLNDFIMDNQALLSSGGYRVMFERLPDGGVQARVVRIFHKGEREVAKEFAQHVQAEDLVSLHEGNRLYVRQWTDRSPVLEDLDRQFANEAETAFTPGESPADGVPPTFHGTDSPGGLPERLNKRDLNRVGRGNMFGPGFYSTVDTEVAGTYGANGLYAIRGSRTGRRYKVFDLDTDITPDQAARLSEHLEQYRADRTQQMIRDGEADYRIMDFSEDVDQIRQVLQHIATDDGQFTGTRWRDLYTDWLDGSPFRTLPRTDKPVTDFLEAQEGAGALTHLGGNIVGHREHQVYIWLHPEDLHVRPAYEKTGRYYALEEWLEHPNAQERILNAVPENRILRVGDKPRAATRRAERQETLDREFETAEARRQAELDELEALFDSHIDDVHQGFIRRLLRRREFGQGYATWQSHDGNKIHARNALEGPGGNYTYLISGSPQFARLTDDYQRTLSMMREKAVGQKRIPPPLWALDADGLATRGGREAAAEYYQRWAELVNDQIRNSPMWYKMLEGQTDDQILSWLRNTDEGARIRREISHKGYNPERWVAEHRASLNFYVPDRAIQRLLRDRQIKPSELRRTPRDLLPEVYGPDLEMVHGAHGWGKAMGDLNKRIYRALGTVPTDLLSRQPFFKGMYDLHMRNLIRSTDADMLTPEVIRGYESLSRQFALRQVKRTMYDLMDDTNLTHALRFLAPFWGAQYEAMTKWARIIVDRPETMARFYVGVNLAYDRIQIIDEDGNPTKDPNSWMNYNANDRMILQIPKNLTKIAPFDKMLNEFGKVGIPFGSANTVLQGENFMLPSLGPIVTLPADELVRRMWDDHGSQYDDNFFMRWLFPVGRSQGGFADRAMEQLLPGWGRRLFAWQKGSGSRMYNNTYWSVEREMRLDHNKRGLPPPTPDEIKSAVDWHMGLRVLASFGMPTRLEFRPKHQMYLDAYHTMVREFGPSQAFEKFVAKYGAEAARYAISSSTSVGIPATSEGMKEFTQIRDLLQDLPEESKWVAAMISPDAWADDFSSDAYGAQFEIEVGGGNTDKLRTLNSPKEREAMAEEKLGWLEYRQFTSALNAELYARGLHSLNQVAAQDLADLKSRFVSQQRDKYPGWARALDEGADSIYSDVDTLRQWVYDKRFEERPDIQGVRQYLAIRDTVAEQLDAYAAAGGGSRNLQNQSDPFIGQLRTYFYSAVGQLAQDNPAFAEFYSRYLESDTLERGSG